MKQKPAYLRVGILEDNSLDAQHIAELIESWSAEHNTPVFAEVHHEAQSFLAAAKREPYHVVLLDCYLDEAAAVASSRLSDAPNAPNTPFSAHAKDTAPLTGMDVAKELRKSEASKNAGAGANSPCAITIIFTTSSMDFALEGYEVNAAAYLVKPVEYKALEAALNRAISPLPAPQDAERKLTLKTRDGTFQLAVKNIVWARSRGHYLDFTLRDSSTLRCRMPMHELVNALAGDSRFFSPARGYLINLDEVSGIQAFDFVLASGQHVPISQALLSSARAAYAKRAFERMDA